MNDHVKEKFINLSVVSFYLVYLDFNYYISSLYFKKSKEFEE